MQNNQILKMVQLFKKVAAKNDYNDAMLDFTTSIDNCNNAINKNFVILDNIGIIVRWLPKHLQINRANTPP